VNIVDQDHDVRITHWLKSEIEAIDSIVNLFNTVGKCNSVCQNGGL